MANRIEFSEHSEGLPCKECGFSTLRVASIVGDDGSVVGRTVVCTSCHQSRHRAAEAA
ncbi:hypothetical protein [Amycolatopsis albispora]|uniref:hypothetical protein n=1 Tax=Amycolatopsis albispora TaxID=1804986 RepID=UPI0019622D22|nr:hypothetical protein [Amycolatopsis albispora]